MSGKVPAAALAAVVLALLPYRTARAEDRVEVPLILDLEESGLVTIIPSAFPQEPPEETRVDGTDLFQAFLPVATPQMQTRLWNAIREGFITLRELKTIGVDTKLEMESLTLNVSLPPEARKPKDISLRVSGMTAKTAAVKPARTSAALNIYGSRSVWHENPGTDASGNGARGDFDGFWATPFGAVFEAEASYNEFESETWRRGDVRAVFDYAPELLRFNAGDLRFSAAGFRSYIPLGGIGVTRELTIDPDMVSYPTSNTRVQLRNPSRVDVIVNGAVVRTLRLPAGQFDIREIPLLGRINEVELLITDIFGRTESVRFPFIAANELLRPGLHQFSYNLGLPSVPRAGRYEYDERRLTFSGWHRTGLSDKFTFGGFAQGNRHQAIGGLEALAVNTLGLFLFELAASRLEPAKVSAGAGRFAYRSFQEKRGAGPLGWGLQLETRGRSFTQLGDMVPPTSFRHRADFFVNARVSSRIHGTTGFFRDWPHAGNADAIGVYLNTSASLDDRWQLGVDLSTTDDPAVHRERRAFLTLRWRDPSRPLIAALSTDTRDNSKRGEFAFSATRTRADANFTASRSADTANANLSSYFQRAQLGYGLAASKTKTTPGDTASSTSLFQFGSALAYADGHLVLSRPVPESFALIGDGDQAWQRGILVNPTETVYAGRVDRLGPAVVADLQAYRAREILIDTSPIQTGHVLEHDRFLVIPGYRSGYHLPLKLHSVVILEGRLLGADGQPLALVAGEIARDSSASNAVDGAPIEFFTDREGRFQTEGLNPGMYRLTLYSETWAPAKFQLNDDAKGTMSIGDLKMRKANE